MGKIIIMKKNLLFTLVLAVAGVVATVPSTQAQSAPVKSVSQTSFADVTSQLDPGGNFYLYLGTAQWLDHLSSRVENWRSKFVNMPDAKPEQATNINKAFDIVTRLIQDSGIEDITGLGMSSVEIEKGMYRNKVLLHHYPGKGNGFLWKLCGGAPHPLTGLDLLPTNTALAVFSDADLPLLWNVVQDQVAKSGFPEAETFLQQLPDNFEKKTGVKWDDFINSLGGEFGFVVTLDESKTIPIPVPPSIVEVPEPGIMLVVKVKNDTIFNCIDAQVKKNTNQMPMAVSTETNGTKMLTVPVPLPLPINLRPTAASGGGYLFIATSDALIQKALAVKDGQSPGLKSTAEFKRLAKGLPKMGNQFSFMSERFGKAIYNLQTQVMTSSAAREQSPAQAEWLKSLIQHRHVSFSYSVGVNTTDGCLTIGNSDRSLADLALIPAFAGPGMLAAIAIPNFVKARETSQRNACINNLRMIGAAKDQWALENGKKKGDVPTKADLKPYLRNGKFPHCPAGGTYSINPIGEPPTCSVPGHKLPGN